MKVEIQLRWLALLASVAILFVLRHHKVLLAVYVGLVLAALVLYVVWLPRRLAVAEKRFNREALRLLAADDFPALSALADRQWLLRRFGRRHVVPDTLALAASASGNHEAARALYLQALEHAPPDDRPRIELNLARAEIETGRLDAAEGRLRGVLGLRPRMGPALASLARVLLRKGEELEEAVDLLKQALDTCDPRELPTLRVSLAEARLRLGQAGWTDELTAAQASGAPAEEVARVEALARSQSATSG